MSSRSRFRGEVPWTFVEPLAWPVGWARTPAAERQRSQFSYGRSRASRAHGASLPSAAQRLREELERLGAEGTIRIATNLRVRLDGQLHANQTEVQPDDPGIAVYFDLDGESQVIPCDRWDRVGDNLHAVALSVAALRGLDRWGTPSIVKASFRGFKALPPASGPTSVDQAMREIETLSGVPIANDEDLRRAVRAAASKWHPDRSGGDAGQWHRLDAARRFLIDNGRLSD